MKPAVARVAPNRYSQYAKELSRGNETSGAPIWIGTTKFAKANTIGVAKNSSMIVPCMVNSWLYCSGLRNCWPGRASSERISMAIAPPAMKNASDVTVYIMPICFGSVVQNNFRRDEPLTVSRAEYGRVAIGFGATAVTPASCALTAVTRRGWYPARWRLARLGWRVASHTVRRFSAGHRA